MGFDSCLKPSLSALSKDLPKKKRTNRLAKLKQSKVDARREQWLSQATVKNEERTVSCWRGRSLPSSLRMDDEGNSSKGRTKLRSRGGNIQSSTVNESGLVSLSSCHVSRVLALHDSEKDLPGSSCSSASSRCCSGSVSETEEDDGCLDDWEAVANSLNTSDNKNLQLSEVLKFNNMISDNELSKASSGINEVKAETKEILPRYPMTCGAWQPDDTLRPQGLPNLSKQNALDNNSEQLQGHGSVSLDPHQVLSQPSLCPICYEDLDATDSSFLPCSCGFQLCLFCHKKILEMDDRCPGCRKQYDPIMQDEGFNGGIALFQTDWLITRS
ncbi:uncharacterized protein LOC127804195 [Diospyros lotus]|uniref:uncharacterized protein LOC127804195 n=1 Tax=Diospyros lotus TaxID=55363 RepID=UPI0022573823|nr:uncharacterized protein LOC127804195 [Diospyros lotus]